MLIAEAGRICRESLTISSSLIAQSARQGVRGFCEATLQKSGFFLFQKRSFLASRYVIFLALRCRTPVIGLFLKKQATKEMPIYRTSFLFQAPISLPLLRDFHLSLF
jgi:hypothetical protein